MHNDKRLSDISGRLEKMTIHEVRQLARALSVHFESTQKSGIIEEILSYAQGFADPRRKTKGAPPKSDKHDEQLAAEIAAYRANRLAGNFSGAETNSLSVEDSAYEEQKSLQKEVCGLIAYTGGVYRLLTVNESAAVPRSFFARYNLRAGDAVCGKIVWRKEDNDWALLFIISVNGGPVESLAHRKSFAELKRKYPCVRVRLAAGNKPACKLIDLFAPVALGQRVVVSSPSKGGKTAIVKDIAAALGCYTDAAPVLLLLCGKPEEIADFKLTFRGFKIFSTTFDMNEEEHRRTAELAFEYAKRGVESGKKVILIADGLHATGAEELKKLTCCACATEDGGSLTVIYTLPRSFAGHDEIIDTANAVIVLSAELAQSRVYPAIDAKACFSSVENGLMPEEKNAANALRRNMGAEKIVLLFTDTEYAEILELYKNG